MADQEHILLFEQKGSTSVHISARVGPKGDLQLEGQDIGAAPQEIFGESEYEYTLSVKAGHKDRVLLLLLKELYGGDSSAVSKFRQWLEANSIPFEFETF